MFRTDLLYITWSLNTVFTSISMFPSSYIDCLLADIQHNCCEYSMKTPDDVQYICLKHVQFFTKIKLRNSARFWLLL